MRSGKRLEGYQDVDITLLTIWARWTTDEDMPRTSVGSRQGTSTA